MQRRRKSIGGFGLRSGSTSCGDSKISMMKFPADSNGVWRPGWRPTQRGHLRCQEVSCGGEEARFSQTQKCSGDDEAVVVLNDALESHDLGMSVEGTPWASRWTYDAPRKHENGDPQRRPHEFEYDIAGHFKDAVREEEDLKKGAISIGAEVRDHALPYRQSDVVLSTREIELFVHASNLCVANISTIQEGENIQQCQHW